MGRPEDTGVRTSKSSSIGQPFAHEELSPRRRHRRQASTEAINDKVSRRSTFLQNGPDRFNTFRSRHLFVCLPRPHDGTSHSFVFSCSSTAQRFDDTEFFGRYLTLRASHFTNLSLFLFVQLPQLSPPSSTAIYPDITTSMHILPFHSIIIHLNSTMHMYILRLYPVVTTAASALFA